ncbi:hypothetical protein PQR39_21135 [Paraburkholderia sediminicola]|uniref:hypothetical protein n=1 Tax=Paraburkholderia sediminicola TaxID=458836 RepID=UPI0038BCE534
MEFPLEKVKTWAELALTCASLVAIPVGGWWVYHNFSAEDTHEANPNITVTAEVLPYDDTRRLLMVHVKPKNLGKVPIELDGGKKGDIDVLVKTFPAGLASGRVDRDKLPVAFAAHNIVSKYNGGYVMEPGIDYDEIETFIVPKGSTYLVYTEMDHYDDTPDDEVDDSAVVKVD